MQVTVTYVIDYHITQEATMQERRRKFYGWGYEGDTVTPDEIREFEAAWTRLLGVEHFEATPFPTPEEISLRKPRVQLPASLREICTSDHYDRLYHTYGAGTMDVARAMRRNFPTRRTSSPTRALSRTSWTCSTGAGARTLLQFRTAAAPASWPE
jgi:hypothetical protein